MRVHWLLAVAATWIAMPAPGPATALAERGEALLAGTPAGLFAAGPAGWERTAVSGAVLDLAGDADALWIATVRGLWLWESGAEPRPVALGAGARLRGVALDARANVWVATESGLFLRSRDGAAFERDTSLPPGDVIGLRASGTALFAAREGALWIRRLERFEPLATGLGEGWWELRAAAAWRGSVYLAVPEGLWRVDADSAERLELASGDVRDVRVFGSALWVATSNGLWRYAEPAELSRGAPPPVLDASVARLLVSDARLIAATDRGVAEIDDRSPARAELAQAAEPQVEPDVKAVQAAALAYQDLAPEKLREVEKLARRRAWLPLVRAGAGTDDGRSHDYDHDEAFTSGELRNLYDTHRAHDRSFEADFEVAWDLGRLADPEDAIAVSRERRLVVELRDQVLERVNRLYFERLRARDALSATGDAAKRRELELRVAELTAQLDAWTGGRFSRLLDDSPPTDRRQP